MNTKLSRILLQATAVAMCLAAGGIMYLELKPEAPSSRPQELRKLKRLRLEQGAVIEEKGNPYKIEKEYWAQRWVHNGVRKSLPGNPYDAALLEWNSQEPALPAAAEKDPARRVPRLSGVNGTTWKPIGPNGIAQGASRVNGRVVSVGLHPTNPGIVYQGSNYGGLWKTFNGGADWMSLTDQQPSLGIGENSAVAVDPNNPNIVYVGTSGRWEISSISKGLLKSVDGGGTWVVVGSGFPAGNDGNTDDLFTNRQINAIIIDPANSNRMYMGTSIGLYFSNDAGQNWTPGTNGGGDCRSLVIDLTSPVNARILYAGVGGTGVRRSADGGQNWNLVLTGATPAVQTALAGGQFGKVVVALAPPTNPPNANGIQVLYCTMQGNIGGSTDPVGIFMSTNAGNTWTQRAATGLTGRPDTQGGFNMTLSVDPVSPGNGAADILYYGAVSMFRSTDSGANFANTQNSMHVDTHAEWTFRVPPVPGPTIVYTGNDGGIWRSDNNGGAWTGTGQGGAPPTINTGGLQTALFYNMDVRRDNTASVTMGCLQDNGHVRATAPGLWTDTAGGDGWDLVFDYVNLSEAYQTGGFYSPAPCTRAFRSTDSGATWPTEITPPNFNATDGGCYLAPLASDPSNAGFIYLSGSNNLHQTRDRGATWRIILPNTGGAGQVAVSPTNPNSVVYARGSQVFVSTNVLAATVGAPNGVQFTNISRNLPGRNVARVAFDPNDPSVIYCVLSGFDSQTAGQPGHVFRTTVAAATWDNISPAVDVPYNALVLDGLAAPTAIYVGTDFGVLRSVDGGATWGTLDDLHLPNTAVTDLVLNTDARVLRASTFGRGVFELAQPTVPVVAVNAENGLNFGTVCSGETEYLNLTVFNVGGADLQVDSVSRVLGSTEFSVLANPPTPVTIGPNSHVDFTVQFTPTGAAGPRQATIRVASNDPAAPTVDLTATAIVGEPNIAGVIADSGDFGEVCRHTIKDMNLTVNNSGSCDLVITGITSNNAEFLVPSVVVFPLTVAPGTSLAVPLRYAPDTVGTDNANISVASNDADTPSLVIPVTGKAPQPTLTISPCPVDFGEIRCEEDDTNRSKTVYLCNDSAECPITIVEIQMTGPDASSFTLGGTATLPTTIDAGGCLPIEITFTPTSTGPKTATLRVLTGDPTDNVKPVFTCDLTGSSPYLAGSIVTPPSIAFPPTVIQASGPCETDEPLDLLNMGPCNATITTVTLEGGDVDAFSIVGLVPEDSTVVLQPGEQLGEGELAIRFKPATIIPRRFYQTTASVTYIADPYTSETTTTVVPVAGEGVDTGFRVLATLGGVPVPKLDSLQVRASVRRGKSYSLRNLPLKIVNGPKGFEDKLSFQYHAEFGGLSNPTQKLTGDYRITAKLRVGRRTQTRSVNFNVNTCTFNNTLKIDF